MAGAFAGTAGLHVVDRENRIARVGYWIDGEHSGRRYVTRAVSALVDAAIHDLVRLGFREEGVHRQVLAIHGGFQDLVIYAMLAGEWNGCWATDRS